MEHARILIVDDNKDVLVALKLLLAQEFSEIITAHTPEMISGIMKEKEVGVILLDMNFRAGINTGNEGIFWLREILKADPDAMVVFITAYGDIDLAVKAMKEGAIDFIQKPWEDQKLLSTIKNALKIRNSRREIKELKSQKKLLINTADEGNKLIVGDSPAMMEVMRTIKKVAPTDAGILLVGENGTGKELLAREIHRSSARSEEVFVRVDLGALAPTLFESELFGHMKGAFTGAVESRPGRFEMAHRGSLFLDEIANIPTDLQAKLLSVVQNREVYRIGSNQPVPVDIRLISATNVPLEKLVGEMKFREDLLYRINTIKIEIPPLRERTEEIPVLLDHFTDIFCKKYHKERFRISGATRNKLARYTWPGNVREFKHTVEKAIILAEGDELTEGDFFFEKPFTINQSSYTFNLEENEKELIRKALKMNRGNISRTAEDLGISRKTLYNKLDRYEIEPL